MVIWRKIYFLLLCFLIGGIAVAQPPATENASAGLRQMFFSGKASSFGLNVKSSDEIWGVAFEWGVSANGSITLIALKDGTTSLYYSTGGGIIGAGERPDVRLASNKLFKSVVDDRLALHETKTLPLASTGHVIFYALSDDHPLSSGEIDVADIQKPGNTFYAAGNAAQAVISKIRIDSTHK